MQRRVGWPLAMGVAIGVSAPALACTAGPMTVAELADHAGQVVVGEVTVVRSRWTEDGRSIESDVTLTNVKYLKGRRDDSGSAFTLTVPGGTVGTVTMRLCCAPEIEAGQQYLMFLLPEYRTYPTAGMAQGMFRIEADEAGVERVYSSLGAPIAGIDAAGAPFTIVRRDDALARHRLVGANGAALRAERLPEGERLAPVLAMEKDRFIEAVAPAIDVSRAHELDGPAGRRVPVAMTPTTLKLAPGAPAQLGEDDRAVLSRLPRPERRAPEARAPADDAAGGER